MDAKTLRMKAALLRAHYQPLEIEEVEVRQPLANEVQVKLVSTGVCGTDWAFRDNVKNRPLPMPIILGHEGAGIVTAVGPGVTKVKVGDHVATSTPWCGACSACVSGEQWFCERVVELELEGHDYFGGSPISKNGKPVWLFLQESTFAEYVCINVNGIVKLPDDIDLKIAGPLGCGFRTGAGTVYNALKARPNQWIAIFGTGPVGMAAMWMAKAMGCVTIMVDVRDNRLEVAKDLGADYVLNSAGMSAKEIAEAIRAFHGGKGIDLAADTTAQGEPVKACMMALRMGGTCACVAPLVSLSFDDKPCNEGFDGRNIVQIRMGNVEGDVIVPMLVDMYRRGQFPFDKLIKFYKFDEINQAMADSQSGKVMKPVLLFE